MNFSENLVNTIRWISRITTIIFILFLSMFAFDVFGEAGGFWRTTAAFLIHMIPSFVMIAVLALSWKRPLVGGIVFMAIAVSYLFWSSGSRTYAIISVPLFVIAALFILNWVVERSKVH